MTDFAGLLVPDDGRPAHALRLIRAEEMESWLSGQPANSRAVATAQRFKAKPGQLAIIPATNRGEWSAILGVDTDGVADPWALAAAADRLPEGRYRLTGEEGDPGSAALGWLLAQYRFDRYRADSEVTGDRVLLSAKPAAIAAITAQARGIALVRDLVNTPAGDLGPAELADAVSQAAAPFHLRPTVIDGAALRQSYPMIAAVGRAASPDRAARLIELEWGEPSHPRIAIIGKGVCFDTGGLDIKPASAMLLMKKDMGGAAHALALALLVIEARLPVRLHLLIPAVENAVSADAFRPGDILTSRKGLSVEIGNTDAEGRLILADALTRAGEENPALILDFATLTGAARVALGPDLPAMFSNDEALAADLLASGEEVRDPLWRLPLWKPYADMLKSTVADINNAGEGGMAGAITAALFLARFVPEGIPWAHLDGFAWRPSAKPGRPKGGDALGLRAAFAMLSRRFPSPAR